MNAPHPFFAHGALLDNRTVVLQRQLPASLERVWDYLIRSELRRQWLASGEMRPEAGSEFEWVWRHDELSAQTAPRPEGFVEEYRMKGTVLSVQPLRQLVITWGENSEVCFDLEAQSDSVALTVTHRRAPNQDELLSVSAGWHAHLAMLIQRVQQLETAPFWPEWQRLRAEYQTRFFPG